ncbi:MAG: AfsR/SARP family transcriptional regulator [Actinomycetota bacterium]|nr:AfsR/SARP family transcriptional regulator [Actinomycetota bacterium]
MTVQIDLLGPLSVSVDGRPVPLTAARLRAVLVVLALCPGEPVSLARMADAVWGDDPPGNARRALQVYVTRLRKALGSGVIRTGTAGYALTVAPEQVDAVRFARLVEVDARETDPEAERTRLVEALAMWRGDPFDDVRSAWLNEVEATRLVDLRLAALERRVELDLTRRRTTGLVAELRGLTRRYPLRERFWSQLMTALEHTGQRADALLAYQRLYRLLVREMGIEPSSGVQEVHRRVLGGASRDGSRSASQDPRPAARTADGQPAR